MAKSHEQVTKPAPEQVKPNIDIPKGVRAERAPERGINSTNSAGGEVDPSRYRSKPK